MSINVEAEKRAYKKFRQAGMTAAGACGLIGNLEAESDGFYTNRVEYLCLKRLKENGKVYTDTTYTAAIDSGKFPARSFYIRFPENSTGTDWLSGQALAENPVFGILQSREVYPLRMRICSWISC